MADNPGVNAEIHVVEASPGAAGQGEPEATAASSGLSRRRKSEDSCTFAAASCLFVLGVPHTDGHPHGLLFCRS